MGPLEAAQLFLSSPDKLARYHDAISILHDIGFENVLRRLGEPRDVQLEHPQLHQIAAHDNSEKRGWHYALDAIFYFDDYVNTETKNSTAPDFGGRQILRSYSGASEAELEQLIEDTDGGSI